MARSGDCTLARRFAKIVDDPRLRFRLEVVETDACRNFHSDQVLARLLVTLHGRGTQWIVAGEDGSEPHEMSVGDVAIFKGRLWTDELAIQHRSPPIAGSGSTRLLLVLNPLQKASRPSVLFDAGDVGQADLPALG